RGEDQFGCGGRRLSEDPEPDEGVGAEADVGGVGGEGVPADTGGPVTPGDGVAAKPGPVPVSVGEVHLGCRGGDLVEGDVGHSEVQATVLGDTGADEVLEDFVLRVEPHGSADEVGEVDAATPAVEAQWDSFVLGALGQDPGVETDRGELIHGALFEDPRADGAFDLVPYAGLHDDRVDALGGEEMGKSQTGRACTDDRHLGSAVGNVHGINGTGAVDHSPEECSIEWNIHAIMCACRSLVRMTVVR